ncbi:MAG: glutaredoxin family protein [Acidobacteriota bacterium]|nr:glutaredoxin family protein [Acidobacteriota bacterium]
MDETALQILRAFDCLKLTRLSEADLLAVAADSAEAQASLAQLVDSGALREVAGQYERTEFGRLEVAGPSELTLLTRAGCHLCDQALRQIEPLVSKLGAHLRFVDVDSDRVLREDYGLDVPVLFLGNREIARHRIEAGSIRAALSKAKKRGVRAQILPSIGCFW